MTAERYEEQIEDALWELEVKGNEESALSVYRRVTSELEVAMEAGDVDEADARRVLSYGYLRQANIVRGQGALGDARALGEKSVDFGRASGDGVALARAFLNHAATLAMMKHPDVKQLLDECLALFSSGSSDDHMQGVGWHWILVADLCSAGLLPGGATAVIAAAEEALQALIPIKNWQGIARAHSSLEHAYKENGDEDLARQAREAFEEATNRAQLEMR